MRGKKVTEETGLCVSASSEGAAVYRTGTLDG